MNVKRQLRSRFSQPALLDNKARNLFDAWAALQIRKHERPLPRICRLGFQVEVTGGGRKYIPDAHPASIYLR
jgi:hypothetical protein